MDLNGRVGHSRALWTASQGISCMEDVEEGWLQKVNDIVWSLLSEGIHSFPYTDYYQNDNESIDCGSVAFSKSS